MRQAYHQREVSGGWERIQEMVFGRKRSDLATVNVMETALSIIAVPSSIHFGDIDGKPTGSILNKPSNKADSTPDSPSDKPGKEVTRGSEARGIIQEVKWAPERGSREGSGLREVLFF